MTADTKLKRMPAGRSFLTSDRFLQSLLLVGSMTFMTVGLLLPLVTLIAKSITGHDGEYVGIANFISFFTTPSLFKVLYNTMYISLAATSMALPPAFVFAYAMTRTAMPGKTFFKQIAMLPLYAPTMLIGLSLVYMFGRKGIVTSGFFGLLPWLGIDIGLYGPVGIILAEAILVFPPVAMILMTSLANSDARLYEAAEALGAGRPEIFWSVTIPGVKFGILSSIFVSFTLVFTDFGAPKVVGGNYSVLATDIYKHVVGQQNFNLGATVSIVMIAPTLLAFIADNWIRRRQTSALTAKAVPLVPKRNRRVETAAFIYCLAIVLMIIAVFGTAAFASLADVWPYKLVPSLKHYNFRDFGGGGYAAFWNSLRLAGYSAVFGTIMTFGSAYLIEKAQGMALPRKIAYLISLIPLALPGLVLGLAYIFLFNPSHFRVFGHSVTNPLSGIYGTMAILVICNIVHFYTVGFLTASTALRQIDKEFELVAESMSVPFYVTLWRVTLPLCLPSILDIAGYYFVSSMATISAAIFLYTPDLRLASVAVVNMDDAGDTAPAAAMGMLIVLANIVAKLLFELASRRARKKAELWQTR